MGTVERDKRRLQREEELKSQLQGLTGIQKKYYICQKLNEIGLVTDYDQLQEIMGNDWTAKDEISALSAALAVTSKQKINPIHRSMLVSMKNTQVENQDWYQETNALFQNVLEQYKTLSQDLHLEKVLDKSCLFTYLLWNGYFSYNKQHTYDIKNRYNIAGMFFLDLIPGGGVCLNYADALSKYLQVCGMESDILACRVSSLKKHDLGYRPNIVRNQRKSTYPVSKLLMTSLSWFTKIYGNHAVTLIKEQNRYLAYDPTNLLVLNIDNEKTASVVTGEFQYDLKLWTSFLLTNSNGQIYNDMLAHPFTNSVQGEEVISSFENTLSIIYKEQSSLDAVYDTVQPDLNQINQILTKKVNK